MLKSIQPLLSYHLRAVLSSFNLLCRTPVSSLMTIVVLAIALTLPALFWVFIDNLNQMTSSWSQNSHISLYLKTNLTENQTIKTLKEVQATPGVAEATLKSPQEGLAELTSQEGMHDIMHYLPENPLPAVIQVTPSIAITSAAHLDGLLNQLTSRSSIEHIQVDRAWIDRLHTLLHFITQLSNTLLALLALAVVLIIGNTLRLGIQSRYEEIQVLKLIGATEPFIIRPFLYSGMWYGFAGAVVAIFLVNIFVLSLSIVINRLTIDYQMHYPLSGLTIRQILLLVLFSTILGWVAARLSVKKQLTAIEPAL